MFGTRLTVELKKARLESDQNFFLYADEDLKTWRAFILGPADSPYENGAFHLRLNITQVVSVLRRTFP
jgi:ubiquitin-protein ligase